MNSGETKRCDNLACLCEVPLTDPVCGPYCDSPDGRDPEAIVCKCGHPVCKQDMDEQLHGGIGRESPP